MKQFTKNLLIMVLLLFLYNSGKAQKNIQFSMSSSGPFLEAAHVPVFQVEDELTLEATVFLPARAEPNTRIIDKFQASGNGGYLLGIGKENKLWARIGNNQLVSSSSIPLNKWVHLLATFSRSKAVFKIYIDGQEAGKNSGKLSKVNHTNFPLRIGHDANYLSRLNGSIDKISIYNSLLTDQEAGSLAGGKTMMKGKVSSWILRSGTGNRFLNQMTGMPELRALRSIKSVATMPPNHNLLWYTKPAEQWTDALPIGNGRLGAMIFGAPEHERLQLNDITIWSGGPQPNADRGDAWKHLGTIRKLIREEKYDVAADSTERYFTSPAPYDASYQTLGELSLSFMYPKGEMTDYFRSLDIGTAISKTQYKVGKALFTREIFSSAPDQALITHIKSSEKGCISFVLDLGRLENTTTQVVGDNQLIMRGHTGPSLDFEVQLKVLTKGGKVNGNHGQLMISNADEATIYLVAGSTYILNNKKGYKGLDPHRELVEALSRVSSMRYPEVKDRHIKDYASLFNRLKFQLGSDRTHISTPQRLKEYGEGKNDPAFAALFYQYGRYLLISSSRSDNPLPSNSQGIWGDGLVLPWMCDYKSNINYQMNYWQAEQANLSELHDPMIRMSESLQEPGSKSAKAYFGPDTPGWYYGYTTNAWGWTSPGAHLPWGVFAGGSGWACQHLWEHYAFTRDREYLKKIFPVLKGASEFYMNTMIADENGALITSPSTSPENEFRTEKGVRSTVSEGNTMERAIIWDLLNNTAQAASILGTEEVLYQKLTKARDKIRPLQIGRYGQLMEWGKDWDDTLSTHRHVSHLFPLHPGRQITALGTPRLAAAARKSLEFRTDIGTGWSKAWKINFWARLRDGDRACKLLADQLTYTENSGLNMSDGGGTYPNLFDAHPPFQIDGNFGAVSGISEMLLQSMENYAPDKYILDLLPALPSNWKQGNISGLRARGGFEVSINWKDARLVTAGILSLAGEDCRLRTREAVYVEDIIDQKRDGDYFITTFKTTKGKEYHVTRK